METQEPHINLIKEFEGLRLNAYKCPANVWTIGFGHTGKDVSEGQTLSESDALDYLKADIKPAADAVDRLVKVPLNQNQKSALNSFTYNLGQGNLGSSNLLKRLNAGEDPNTVAREELPKWNKGGGKVLNGLIRRRAAEVELFTK